MVDFGSWGGISFDPTGSAGGDIESALQSIMARIQERQQASPRAGSVNEAALREDERRFSLVQALQRLAGDTGRSAAINQGVEAQMALARQNAGDQAAGATGSVTAGAADRGMLGSSAVNRAKGQITAGKDQAIRAAATSATNWKQGVKDADSQYLYGTLNEILSPTQASQGAQNAMMQGYQTNLGLGQQLSDVQAQQNQLLAQSIGGFMQNTMAPAIGGAFQVAGARRDAAARGQAYQPAWQMMMNGNP